MIVQIFIGIICFSEFCRASSDSFLGSHRLLSEARLVEKSHVDDKDDAPLYSEIEDDSSRAQSNKKTAQHVTFIVNSSSDQAAHSLDVEKSQNHSHPAPSHKRKRSVTFNISAPTSITEVTSVSNSSALPDCDNETLKQEITAMFKVCLSVFDLQELKSKSNKEMRLLLHAKLINSQRLFSEPFLPQRFERWQAPEFLLSSVLEKIYDNPHIEFKEIVDRALEQEVA